MHNRRTGVSSLGRHDRLRIVNQTGMRNSRVGAGPRRLDRFAMLTVCLSCTSEYAIDPACIEADGRRRRCVPGFKAPEKSRVSHDDPIPMTLSHGSATPMPDLERDFVSVKARATRWPYTARAERRKPVPLRRMGL